MRTLILIWDEDTVDHLAEHGVSPEEAQEVCRRSPYVLRTRGGRYIVLGQTASGRYLTIVVAPRSGGYATLVTARGMTDAERRRYLRR